jgi:solute carrier family 25 carnitine/acylcarnitine transporter 20/29
MASAGIDSSLASKTEGSDALKRVLVSAVPAVCWATVGTPFDVIRVRLQTTGKDQFKGPIHCLRTTIRTEGVGALFKGFLPSILWGAPYSSILFGLYGKFKPQKPASSSDVEWKQYYLQTFFLASIIGVPLLAIQNPLDVYRTRLQAAISIKDKAPVAKTSLSIFVRSPKLLFRGLSMSALRHLPGNGLYLTANEFLNHQAQACSMPINPHFQRILSGGCTGVLFTVLFFPAQVLQTRLQVTDPGQGGLLDKARELRAQNGWRGFYRGASVTITRSFASNAMGFWALEVAKTLAGLN